MLKKLKDFDARECADMRQARESFSVLDELFAYMYVSLVMEEDRKVSLPFKSTNEEMESTKEMLENMGYLVDLKSENGNYYTHSITVTLPKRLQNVTD